MTGKRRRLLKTLGRVLLFVALLVLPTVLRAGYYYRRYYVPRAAPRPDHSAIDVPVATPVAFADADARQSEGRVVIDRAHENRLDDSDLNVLLARLTNRGLETVSLLPGDRLADRLRNATALVVIAPHQSFTDQEIEAVTRFVAQGGRLLLVTDPSRYALRVEFDAYYGEIATLSSDVAAINSLASRFGLAFADDYLYNTAEHAGNYQYVILKDFTKSPLTAGLEQVVFYAAHSIAADEQTLITADERTTSSLSEQSGGLATMSLGGGGRVLAVSDFTFMTEPYNGSADNNRLIANIADFIAAAARTYGLSDLPHFFGDDVDLILLTGEPGEMALSAAMVDQGYALQAAFQSAGKRLHLQAQPDAARDTLFVGLYGGVAFAPQVSEILTSRGISFTLETVERQRATPTATPRYTPTPAPTPAPLRDWIHVAGVGQVDATEVALIYQNQESDRQVVIVLAFTEQGLGAAIQRLILGDLSRCLLDQDLAGDPQAISLALCPTDYQPPVEEPTPTPLPVPTPHDGFDLTPTPPAEGSLLIVADDNGTGVYEWWTSAYDFQDIALEAGYQATIWSTSWEGEVTLEQMQAYGGVIWCTGDYQEAEMTPSLDDFLTIAAYLADGGRVILAGAFIGSEAGRERGLLLDIQVAQPDHPLSSGLAADEVVTLERFTAIEDYSPYVLDETNADAIVFTRGPASEFAGRAVISVNQDELSGGRTVFFGFPLYLVPWEARFQLGENAIRWLMEG